MGIDYRDLLARYIEHVGECEGSTFIWHIRGAGYIRSGVVFSDEEVDELHELSDQESLPPEKHQHNDNNQHNTEAAANVWSSVITAATNAAEQQDDE